MLRTLLASERNAARFSGVLRRARSSLLSHELTLLLLERLAIRDIRESAPTLTVVPLYERLRAVISTSIREPSFLRPTTS
jgi:hypothetical protein